MVLQNITSIDGGTIEMGLILFDILTLDHDGQLVVFSCSGTSINNVHREKLLDKNLRFFVRISDYQRYLDYIFDRIERTVTSQYVDSKVKSELLFNIGKFFVNNIHKSPSNSLFLEKFGRFVKSYIDLMSHSSQAAANLLELTSSTTYSISHSFNVCTFCMLIGIQVFGHKRKKLWELGMGGILMDIGMSKIDPVILNKKDHLTKAETDLVRKHIPFGHDIVSRHNMDSQIQAMVLYHHERFDGSGYPSGFYGEEIPLYARIAAVADVYDAITSDRAYKNKTDHVKALAEMYSQASEFDPLILNALMKVVLRNDKLIRAFKEKYQKQNLGRSL